jgi:ribulose 1,5-bisphosphate synthetase/thiazole synthase
MTTGKVIIPRGGVAGMSGAHGLAERGSGIRVFEKKIKLPGGNACGGPDAK